MDTGAACRTYNVLLAEGRPVGAALIAGATEGSKGGTMQAIIDNPRACLGRRPRARGAAADRLAARPATRIGLGLLAFLLRLAARAGRHGLDRPRVLRQLRAARRPAERPTSRARRSCTRPSCHSVAWWFRHASTVTVLSGVVLLVLAGYLLPSLVYGTSVYMPPRGRGCCGSASSARSPCGCSCTCTSGPICRWCWACGPAMPRPRREPARASSCSPGSISCSSLPVVLAMVAAAHLY